MKVFLAALIAIVGFAVWNQGRRDNLPWESELATAQSRALSEHKLILAYYYFDG